MKETKVKKPLSGSAPATVATAVAIGELLKTRVQQAVLNRRAKLLREMIIKQGGGAAHGHRTYVSNRGASYRMVRTKATKQLVLVKMPEPAAIVASN